MTEATPTPRPWALEDGNLIWGPRDHDYGSYSSGPIATVNPCLGRAVEPGIHFDRDFPESEANAELIVRAVNNIDSLIAALEAASNAIQEFDFLYHKADGSITEQIDAVIACAPVLRAALAAAKGGRDD